MLFTSKRCAYREFGSDADGMTFAQKHPQLAEDIKNHDIAYLQSKDYPAREALASVIRRTPEYLAFLKTTCRKDFFFAAFDQSKAVRGQPDVKKTGPKDVEKFVLERIKNQYVEPRTEYEFVVENKGQVVGYVELFDRKVFDGGSQCERGLFITPDQQSHGFGKEAILALTDYAFQVLKMDRIFTMVDPNNQRSLNNIVSNSGAVQVGIEDSKYAHLEGGGEKRFLFHIYPDKFYATVAKNGNQDCLMSGQAQQDTSPAVNMTPAQGIRQDTTQGVTKGLPQDKPPRM